MKTTITKVIVAILCLLGYSAMGQNLSWVGQVGGSAADRVNGLATDASGNAYVTGQFSGTADFDPGQGTYNMTANGGSDIFVAKVDATGNLVWALQFGSANTSSIESGDAIGVSPLGFLYVAGRFAEVADFDPGTGIADIAASTSSCGSVDIFLLKLDNNGNFAWARGFGGTGLDAVRALAVGPDESVHISGSYTTTVISETVDFDPGPASYPLSNGGLLTAEFLLKLNGSGDFVWAKQFSSSNLTATACIRNVMFKINALQIDGSGRVHAGGSFNGTSDFDPGSAVFSMNAGGLENSFVLKLSATGNFLWAKSFAGGNNRLLDLALDGSGRVHATGWWMGTVDFDPGTGVVSMVSKNNSNSDAFVAKLTAAGAYVWVKALAGSGGEAGTEIEVDPSGNVYSAGGFSGTVDFNPASAKFNLTSAGGNDVYISKLTSAGKFVWANSFGGASNEDCAGFSVSGYDILTAGYFAGTADFDPSASVYSLISAGSNDGFLHKMVEGSSARMMVGEDPEDLSGARPVSFYPNPTSGVLTVEIYDAAQTYAVKIFSLTGQCVQTLEISGESFFRLDLSALEQGIYIIELKSGLRTDRLKVVKND